MVPVCGKSLEADEAERRTPFARASASAEGTGFDSSSPLSASAAEGAARFPPANGGRPGAAGGRPTVAGAVDASLGARDDPEAVEGGEPSKALPCRDNAGRLPRSKLSRLWSGEPSPGQGEPLREGPAEPEREEAEGELLAPLGNLSDTLFTWRGAGGRSLPPAPLQVQCAAPPTAAPPTANEAAEASPGPGESGGNAFSEAERGLGCSRGIRPCAGDPEAGAGDPVPARP